VKEEALAFKMVYNVCILSDLKDISGKLSETPWIYEKTVV
jgi:hypothetical protein